MFIRVKGLPFPITRDHYDHPFFCDFLRFLSSSVFQDFAFPKSLLSSSTSSGHSGQLLIQHTIMSHLSTRCRCFRKLRLKYSNSICTRCNRPGEISRNASQSGNLVRTTVATCPAPAPSPQTGTALLPVGTCSIAVGDMSGPYTGRSFLNSHRQVSATFCRLSASHFHVARQSSSSRPSTCFPVRVCARAPASVAAPLTTVRTLALRPPFCVFPSSCKFSSRAGGPPFRPVLAKGGASNVATSPPAAQSTARIRCYR